jgi:hypothetical protein
MSGARLLNRAFWETFGEPSNEEYVEALTTALEVAVDCSGATHCSRSGGITP